MDLTIFVLFLSLWLRLLLLLLLPPVLLPLLLLLVVAVASVCAGAAAAAAASAAAVLPGAADFPPFWVAAAVTIAPHRASRPQLSRRPSAHLTGTMAGGYCCIDFDSLVTKAPVGIDRRTRKRIARGQANQRGPRFGG